MFELRWKMHQQGPLPRESIYLGEQRYKYLQYRVMINPTEIGIQEPIWSEWAIVPQVL